MGNPYVNRQAKSWKGFNWQDLPTLYQDVTVETVRRRVFVITCYKMPRHCTVDLASTEVFLRGLFLADLPVSLSRLFVQTTGLRPLERSVQFIQLPLGSGVSEADE